MRNGIHLRQRGHVCRVFSPGGRERSARAEKCRLQGALPRHASRESLYNMPSSKSWSLPLPRVRAEVIRAVQPLPRHTPVGPRVHRGRPGDDGGTRTLRQPGGRRRLRGVSQASPGAVRGRRREPPPRDFGRVVLTGIPGTPRPARRLTLLRRRPGGRAGSRPADVPHGKSPPCRSCLHPGAVIRNQGDRPSRPPPARCRHGRAAPKLTTPPGHVVDDESAVGVAAGLPLPAGRRPAVVAGVRAGVGTVIADEAVRVEGNGMVRCPDGAV